jgi:transposase
MGKHRTPYPAEFRAQMVDAVKARRTPEELEKEFEPAAQTIYNWWHRPVAMRACAMMG